ncbi:deaminase domain-containing protein [Chitinophaga sp. S165]|uniref:deaminase domain-containing protein n=1 Tax=Chitinophaga sp. S165 TaxID=2135462 RepID=UPI000D709F66|nr:deaminase domain-containing protein [Chitinophaga sp. S165]PWV46176.1 fibronectin type III domain protein [Chitinophaga sp. S165]
MSHIYRSVLCLLLFALGITNVHAQQYPVTASTQIIPPYSVYLPDYAVAGSDKLRVILVQNDLTLPSYNIRLRMTVEQNGTVIMRTAAMFNPKPLSLSAGIPTIIGGIDLADYLNPANIEYSGGFSRDQYEKTRSLPEGAYRISFTAFDYSRPQVQVSNMGSNVFFFRKSDPPLLNLPICNSRVEKLDPQFVTFNWSSRNSPNPLPGSGTEYVFSLYEVRPAGSNPDYILRSAKPIYTVVTQSNTIAYGPGEPQLRDSMQYVWVVQARDKSGRDMFSNQGLSQSCTFTYLGNNPFTQGNIQKPLLKGRSTGERSLRFNWEPADAVYKVEAYRVQYRAAKTGDTEFDWQTEEKKGDTALSVNSLEPGRVYEGRMQWKIAGIYGPPSDVVTVKTDSAKTFVCGDAGRIPVPTNKEPLASLSIGKIIRVGNFDIILTEAKGSNGKFSGKGRVITLGFGIGLQMEFKDISINTDMVVTAGNVYASTEGIDKFVNDKLDEQHGGNDVGDVKNGDIVPDIVTKLKLFIPANIKVNTDEGTITLKDNETGKEEVINYKDKGKTLPLVLEDGEGYLFNIDKGGKVTAIGKRDNSITPRVLESLKNLQLDKGTVTFTAGQGNTYGFDAWKDSYAGKEMVAREYESLADGKYHVSAKAIVPGEQEEVIATLTNSASDITAAKLKFITGKGIVLEAKDNGNGRFSIKLTGGHGGDAQEIYAVHPDGKGGYISLGKLLLVSYTPLPKKLVLVPVGSKVAVPEAKIKAALQQAYGKVGITYEVKTDEGFRFNRTWDSNGDSILQDKGSAFLSNGFTGEEKALQKAYKKAVKIDNDAVYLFLVDEAALSDGDLAGKMPRESQFGFVFTKGAGDDNVARTVVHEIGHGDYTLEHTFSNVVGLERSSTDNLMDYGNGFGLLKFQWDILHDPGHVWGVFDEDGSSQNYIGQQINSTFMNKDDKTVSFLSLSGTAVSVPFDSLGSVQFQYGAIRVAGGKDTYDPQITVGAVRAFQKKNSAGTMEEYRFVDAEGVYRNSNGERFIQIADTTLVDGFVYPVQCDEKYKLFKFARIGVPAYKGGEPKLNFTELVGRFNPFKGRMPMKGVYGGVLEQEVPMTVNGACQYCISPVTISMIKGHCSTAEYIWVDKLAQMRNVFPDYFDKFTQTNFEDRGNWEMPQTVSEVHVIGDPNQQIKDTRTTYDYQYPWGAYLKKHDSIKVAYNGNKELFFETFYTEFVKFINTSVAEDDHFWENLYDGTPANAIFAQLDGDPAFHLRSVPLEKRELALKLLTKHYNTAVYFNRKDLPYLRLLASFKEEDQFPALVYIEDSITIRKIYELFDEMNKTEDAQIGVLMALSNMITGSGYFYEKEEKVVDELEDHNIIAQVEADMLQFKNVEVELFDTSQLLINKKLFRYNDIVTIKTAGKFAIGDKVYERGAILRVPALQVALMASVTNAQVTEKTAWLAVDIGTMIVGVWGAKVLFTAGNYLRKAIVYADLIGSAGGITLQLLDNDAVSDDTRFYLQLSCFAVSLPNMVASIPKIERTLAQLDVELNAARQAGKSQQKIEDMLKVRKQLADAIHLDDLVADAKEIEKRVVAVSGNRTDEVVSWLESTKAVDDKNVYLVVHADGDIFRVMHKGQDIEMTHRSLAQWINSTNNIPADGQLVLLSCVDIETAKNLSRKLGRSIVANDGAVKVYKNGLIEADNGFKYIDEAGNVDDSKKLIIGKQQPAEGDMILLGKATIRKWDVSSLAEAFGINSALAKKLLENKEFITACENSDRLIQVIKKELPLGVNGLVGNRRFTNYREALLTVFTEDPTLFTRLNKQIKDAETILKSGKLTTEKYKQFNAIRIEIENLLQAADFETSFFANSIFTTAIYRNAALSDEAMKTLKAARTKYGIGADQNLLVTEMEMANGEVIEQVSHSGKNPRPTNPPADPKSEVIIPDAVPKDRHYDQFNTGAIDRVQDSESKYLEYIWNKIASGKMNATDIKKINLYSERPVCPSCANAIRIFKEKFPNIEVIVYEGKYLE